MSRFTYDMVHIDAMANIRECLERALNKLQFGTKSLWFNQNMVKFCAKLTFSTCITEHIDAIAIWEDH